jgi:hypothetical protein
MLLLFLLFLTELNVETNEHSTIVSTHSTALSYGSRSVTPSVFQENHTASALSRSITPAIIAEAQISEITSITSLYETLHISSHMLAAASYHEEKDLYNMVINHRAMNGLLLALGFRGYRMGKNSKESHIFSGGYTLRAEEILRERGWGPVSYDKKCRAYSWAEHILMEKKWSTGK